MGKSYKSRSYEWSLCIATLTSNEIFSLAIIGILTCRTMGKSIKSRSYEWSLFIATQQINKDTDQLTSVNALGLAL
jgi:ribosomal protein L37E